MARGRPRLTLRGKLLSKLTRLQTQVAIIQQELDLNEQASTAEQVVLENKSE